MPREQLLHLAVDVDRLLDAGATAAVGNENLLRRGRTLRDLGKKVAALNPVADAVEKLTQASGNAVGSAFLDLVAMTRQVRASLAGTGIAGDLKPVAESGPWQTPLSVRDLNPLHEALSHSGSGREETIKNAAERGTIGDMRLLPALLDALGDGYAPVADLVATRVLPALGRAALPALQSALEFPGKTIDVRRLAVIARIDQPAAILACRRALADGSPPLRAKALELLPDLYPAAEVEKIALEAIADKSTEVRTAALRSLRIGVSDPALDVLCTALGRSSGDEHWFVMQSLIALPHPETPARVLKELAARLAEMTTPPKKTKDAPAPKAKAKQKEADAWANAQRQAGDLMIVLGARTDGDRLAIAHALLPHATDKNMALQSSALVALGGLGPITPEIMPALMAALRHKNELIIGSAIQGLSRFATSDRALAFEQVLAIARRPKLERHLRARAVQFLIGHWDQHADEIEDVLRTLLRDKNSEGQFIAADALLESPPRGRKLLPDLLDMIRTGVMTFNLCPVFPALDPKGEEVLPHVIEILRSGNQRVMQAAIQVLRTYGPKARPAVPALMELLSSNDTYLKAWSEIILREIDR